MDYLWIGIAALLGGIAKGLIGWSNSQESFSGKKFVGTALTALVTAVASSVIYSAAIGIGWPDIAMAFLAGAGADNLRKEVANSIRAKIGGGSQ